MLKNNLLFIFYFQVHLWYNLCNPHFLDQQKSLDSYIFKGFVDGSNQHIRSLTSTTWVIYSHSSQLISFGSACLGSATNNIAEYYVVIKLLSNANSLGIRQLLVHLDSQLIVSQLNGIYRVHDPNLLQKYLRIKPLECNFKYITYVHIPRSLNWVTDALENYVLDWHINHKVNEQNNT